MNAENTFFKSLKTMDLCLFSSLWTHANPANPRCEGIWSFLTELDKFAAQGGGAAYVGESLIGV
jgi:hypothetical protein